MKITNRKTAMNRPMFFASGTNHSGEIRALRDTWGANVGTVAKYISERTKAHKASWIELTHFEGNIFIDSGAFTEVTFPKGVPTITKPLTEAHWDEVFAVYRKAARFFGERAFVVAPDCVAHQYRSLERLERYAEQCIDIWEEGANVLVPLQKGDMSLAQYHRAAADIMDGASFIPSIPMKKDATTADELIAYVEAIRPSAMHLLGLGPDTKKAKRIFERIYAICPDIQLSCDACLITRWVGKTNGPDKGPRIFTMWNDHIKACLEMNIARGDHITKAQEVHVRKSIAFWACVEFFWARNNLS